MRERTKKQWLKRGAATLAVLTLSIGTPLSAPASDYGPMEGPYYEEDSEFVDVMASGVALLPMLATAGACGLIMLPADAYHEVRNPEDDYGHHSEAVCTPPSAAVGYGTYMVAGFPFYVLKKTFWDLPYGENESEQPRDTPQETDSAGSAEQIAFRPTP